MSLWTFLTVFERKDKTSAQCSLLIFVWVLRFVRFDDCFQSDVIQSVLHLRNLVGQQLFRRGLILNTYLVAKTLKEFCKKFHGSWVASHRTLCKPIVHVASKPAEVIIAVQCDFVPEERQTFPVGKRVSAYAVLFCEIGMQDRQVELRACVLRYNVPTHELQENEWIVYTGSVEETEQLWFFLKIRKIRAFFLTSFLVFTRIFDVFFGNTSCRTQFGLRYNDRHCWLG